MEAWRAKELAQLRQLHGELYADRYHSKHVRRQYIPSFFDEVDHDILMGLVRQVVKEARVGTYQAMAELY